MPIFDTPSLSRLLGSIEANHLIVLCGANLMSAVRVAQACYDKWCPTEVLAAPLRRAICFVASSAF
jgi:hypothetical protein